MNIILSILFALVLIFALHCIASIAPQWESVDGKQRFLPYSERFMIFKRFNANEAIFTLALFTLMGVASFSAMHDRLEQSDKNAATIASCMAPGYMIVEEGKEARCVDKEQYAVGQQLLKDAQNTMESARRQAAEIRKQL